MKAGWVILLAVITSVATSVGVHYAAHRWRHLLVQDEPSQRFAPNLVGLTEADAQKNLATLGLKLLIAGREPSDKQEGTVILQSPKVGDLVGPDLAVSLTIALPAPKVPDVTGKTLEEATQALANAGYLVKIGDAVASDKHPKGVVVSQVPAPGVALKQKETVTLQASSGQGAVEVPKLIGLGMDAAKSEASKAGLVVKVQWVSLPETPTYVVLRQTPDAGQQVAPQSEVTIVANQ